MKEKEGKEERPGVAERKRSSSEGGTNTNIPPFPFSQGSTSNERITESYWLSKMHLLQTDKLQEEKEGKQWGEKADSILFKAKT